ncbi:DUF2950 domain-containing protein [Variovorax sp. HJSM1_2]
MVGVTALTGVATHAQQVFPTAEAASEAFHKAIAANDSAAIRNVLGGQWKRFVPKDEIAQDDIATFLAAWNKQHSLITESENRVLLAVGEGNWTLPIPIVKHAAGWRFDPTIGADVMRTRRIGRNELSAIQAVLAYFDAQLEYAQRDRDGTGVLHYAQKIMSTPGRHDGLYWDDSTGIGSSPLGPMYGGQRAGQGYHGYYFKILTAQGENAPGGAYNYIIGGRMRAGFALIAWPIEYGESGVMSFMISHDGALYQRDLGPRSDATARAMTLFNPDASWSKTTAP